MVEKKFNFQLKEKFHPRGIIYAGTSSRRAAFLQACFPHLPLEIIPTGEEPETHDVGYIAKFKLNEGIKKRDLNSGEMMFAADTRTCIPVLENSKFTLQSRGKPKNLDQVYEHFQIMKKIAELDYLPHYRVENSTVVVTNNGKFEFEEIQDTCFVNLNSRISELGTEMGFLNYLLTFDEFYESELYQSSGMQNVKPTDFSAGFSLPVFVRLGFINNINGISPENHFFYKTLMHAIHMVGIGVSFSVMDRFGINIENLEERWDWLGGVAKSALELKQ